MPMRLGPGCPLVCRRPDGTLGRGSTASGRTGSDVRIEAALVEAAGGPFILREVDIAEEPVIDLL
jgi:hypothetical protein